MAARTLRPKHSEEIRVKIQASQLVNRLTKHALGDSEIMTPSQVQAAKVLLAKAVPDLKAVEHQGPGGGPVQTVSLTGEEFERIAAKVASEV